MTTQAAQAGKPRRESVIPLGQPPGSNRSLILRKTVWIGVWLVFLSAPVGDLTAGHHTAPGTVAGWLGLAVFVGLYLTLVFRRMGSPHVSRTVPVVLALLAVLATVLSLTLGRHWLGLYCYVSVACGATLRLRQTYWAIPATALTMLAVGTKVGEQEARDLVVLVVLIGFAMTGVVQMIRTTVELRQARATVAQLAANEERLRLARDLHDLLGHSLSLITLKSELAGRMLPDHPDRAAQQVADIEQVSRQALVDVREAVTGYRRPRLAAELAGARVALTAAGVTVRVPDEPGLAGVPEESEAALAWALREAVTNVVRHSGAERCTVELLRRQTLDGPVLELSVEDDGPGDPGGSGKGAGNGLTGLTERLEKAGGTLEAGRVRRGFRLVARVPVDSVDSVAPVAPVVPVDGVVPVGSVAPAGLVGPGAGESGGSGGAGDSGGVGGSGGSAGVGGTGGTGSLGGTGGTGGTGGLGGSGGTGGTGGLGGTGGTGGTGGLGGTGGTGGTGGLGGSGGIGDSGGNEGSGGTDGSGEGGPSGGSGGSGGTEGTGGLGADVGSPA